MLLAKVAKEKGSKASKISLMIDGEKMASSRTFTVSGVRSSCICVLLLKLTATTVSYQSYDLEGGELIEVNIAS